MTLLIFAEGMMHEFPFVYEKVFPFFCFFYTNLAIRNKTNCQVYLIFETILLKKNNF